MSLRESLFIEEKNYEEERKISGEESKLTFLAIDKLQWKGVGERAKVRAECSQDEGHNHFYVNIESNIPLLIQHYIYER